MIANGYATAKGKSQVPSGVQAPEDAAMEEVDDQEEFIQLGLVENGFLFAGILPSKTLTDMVAGLVFMCSPRLRLSAHVVICFVCV